MEVTQEVIPLDEKPEEVLVVVRLKGDFKAAFECQNFPPSLRFQYYSMQIEIIDGYARLGKGTYGGKQTELTPEGENLLAGWLFLLCACSASISYNEVRVVFMTNTACIDLDFFKRTVERNIRYFPTIAAANGVEVPARTPISPGGLEIENITPQGDSND